MTCKVLVIITAQVGEVIDRVIYKVLVIIMDQVGGRTIQVICKALGITMEGDTGVTVWVTCKVRVIIMDQVGDGTVQVTGRVAVTTTVRGGDGDTGNILNEVERFLSFEDGDLIMTGTHKGVGAIQAGDVFTGKTFEHEQLSVEGSWVVR